MDYNTLDLENVKYNRPSITNTKKYMSEAKYEVEGNFPEDIEILSPHLLAKMPIQTNNRNCYIVLKFNKTNRDFFKFLTGLEEHCKSTILENAMSWFQKDLPIDIIDDYHNQFVKISGTEDPTIKVQIPYDKETGKIDIPMVTDKGVNVNQTTVFEGSIVRVQMRYMGVKFYKQQFASEWFATKIIVYDNYNNDDEEEEFDFRENDDMLSLYSEQPNNEQDTTNIEVKVSKVEDTPTADQSVDQSTDQSMDKPTDQKRTENATDTYEKLALVNVDDIKVNMVTQEPTQEQEPTKEQEQEPVKEQEQEPAKEQEQEPAKEQEQEPAKEPVKEPAKEQEQEPVKEQEQEPVKEQEQEQEPVQEQEKRLVRRNKKLRRPRRRRVRLADGSYKITG